MINTAHRIRSDWTHGLFASDIPLNRIPLSRPGHEIVSVKDLTGAQDAFGSYMLCGETMALTAGYRALRTFPGRPLLWFGCDMIYDTDEDDIASGIAPGTSHFYGNGTADPLRFHTSLLSLPAKSARLFAMALLNKSPVFNLSERKRSNIIFPRLPASQATTIDVPATLTHQQGYQHNGYALEAVRHETAFRNRMSQRGMSRVSLQTLMTINGLWLDAFRKGPGNTQDPVPGAMVGAFEPAELELRLQFR